MFEFIINYKVNQISKSFSKNMQMHELPGPRY